MTSTPRTLALIALLSSAALPAFAQSSVYNVKFLGEKTVSNSLTVGGTTVGGLSGLEYDAATGKYLSNSDDQVAPRFYSLTADISATAFNSVTIDTVTNLSAPFAFASGNNDFENIRLSKDRKSVYITNEGNANTGLTTSISVFDRATGGRTGDILAPAQFTPTSSNGIRFNLGFESQTFTDSTFTKFLTVNEGPLRQDTTPVAGTNTAAIFNVVQPVRIVRFDTATGAAEAQYVYNADALTEPVPVNGTTFGVQGVVDVLAIGQGNYLSLERSFTVGGTAGGGTGYGIKLYEFSLNGASDVSGLTSLVGQTYTPVNKRLVVDFATLRDSSNNPIVLDNVEGMTFGPDSGNGQRSLLFVSDNNFASNQKTQFLAFSVAVAPEAGTFVLAAFALPLLGMVARRRAA